MNPFEDDETQLINEQSTIEIWVETFGRKKNTYIAGWNISDTELKEHIKTIKKKIGCNGTLKELSVNGNKTTLVKTIQLQGHHVDYILEYLTEQQIDINSVRVKG
jgi:translation initiation factor 1 (eIF-1/SUI1)